MLAIALTSGLIVALGASHPPAGSTALLVALGSFSTWNDAITVVAGVVIVACFGELLSYFRLYRMKEVTEKAGLPGN